MVYLVGAGPGDPGLLTVRAAGLLRRADVIIHDALIDPRALELARPQAIRIAAGKRADRPSTPQDEINQLLIEWSRRVKIVVRLKGGDPFVFGRGGEEACALADANVPFVVVPGITAAIGAAACAGIPLTHRGISSELTIRTGHTSLDERGVQEGSSENERTFVYYMPVKRLTEIVDALLLEGVSAATPAAMVASASYANQRTICAPLIQLPRIVERQEIDGPALLIVGSVVNLREHVEWFERRPLFGQRILVARSRAQPSRASARLRALGAEVIEQPTLRSERLEPAVELDAALQSIARYDWVLFTSPAAVNAFWAAVEEQGLDARAFHSARFACLGHATSRAVLRRGIRPDVSTRTFRPGEVLKALASAGAVAGARMLFPNDADGMSGISRRLACHFQVDEVPVHRLFAEPADVLGLRRRLMAGGVDWVIFSSSSTVRMLSALVGHAGRHCRVATIGPRTAATARALGWQVTVSAAPQSIDGLVRSLVNHLKDEERHARTIAGGPRLDSRA